jgi:hypothetical protein
MASESKGRLAGFIGMLLVSHEMLEPCGGCAGEKLTRMIGDEFVK